MERNEVGAVSRVYRKFSVSPTRRQRLRYAVQDYTAQHPALVSAVQAGIPFALLAVALMFFAGVL